MRNLLKQTILSLVIIVHTFSIGMLWFMNKQPISRVAAQPITVQQQDIAEAISGIPVRIVVPSLAIDIPIQPGEYDGATDSWTLGGYVAQFATMTVPANNQQGNTFIYGHNNRYVFGPLKHLQTGAEIIVVTSNGNQFTYIFESARTVIPEDVTLFNYQGPPILTVQTCTGAWHEKRQLYQFKFSGVIESAMVTASKQSERRMQLVRAIGHPLEQLKMAQAPAQLPQ